MRAILRRNRKKNVPAGRLSACSVCLGSARLPDRPCGLGLRLGGSEMLRHENKGYFVKLAMLILVFAVAPSRAQERGGAPRAVTAADYAHAEKFLGYNTNPLVLHSGVRPNWLLGDRFWYRTTTADGSEFVMVDPASGAKSPAFDQVKLAAALSAAAGTSSPAARAASRKTPTSGGIRPGPCTTTRWSPRPGGCRRCPATPSSGPGCRPRPCWCGCWSAGPRAPVSPRSRRSSAMPRVSAVNARSILPSRSRRSRSSAT